MRLRTDNDPQYSGREFKKAMQAPGIRHKFVWKHTPEQNGHVESFHGTLKKEYVWPHDFARFQDAEVVLAKAFVDLQRGQDPLCAGLCYAQRVCLQVGGWE